MGRFLGYIGLHWAVLGCIGLYGLYTEQGFTWLIRVVRMIILTTLRNAQCSVSISSKLIIKIRPTVAELSDKNHFPIVDANS